MMRTIRPVRGGSVRVGEAPRRRAGCLLPAVVGLAMLALGALYGWWVAQGLEPQLDSGRQHLAAALALIDQPGVQGGNLQAARAEFQAAAAAFDAAQAQAGPGLTVAPALGWLPVVGGDLRQATALLALAHDTAGLGTALLDQVQPVVTALEAAPAPAMPPGADLESTLAPFRAALDAAPVAGAQARATLRSVQAARATLDPGSLSSPALRATLDAVDAALPTLAQAVNGVDGLPGVLDVLLGRRAPARFLLVLQDPAELRATGGAIRAIGVLGVDQGRFTLDALRLAGEVAPTVDPPTPTPPDLIPLLAGRPWRLPDANWNPDFPTTARLLEAIDQAAGGGALDGTIALDPPVLQGVLPVLGPLTLPDGRVVGGDRIAPLLDQAFTSPAGGDAATLAAVLGALLDRLQHVPSDRVGALLTALQQALDSGHLLLSVHDEAAARWLAARGWAGALSPPGSDLLAVIDSNMGGDRVNPAINRRLSYTMTLSAEPTQAHRAVLSVDYLNRNPPTGVPCPPDIPPPVPQSPNGAGCYWNYVRVYVPEGSRVVAAQWGGAPLRLQPGAADGRMIFGALLALPPGADRQLVIEYVIPYTALAVRDHYTLTVHRQPGTTPPLATLAVAVRLPLGVPLRTARPPLPPGAASGGWVRTAATPFATDRVLYLGW